MTRDGQARTRVMLVDDHPDFRRLIAALLGRHPDFEVVAEAGSLAEARARAATLSFDVAVLDLGLPDGHGADLIPELRGKDPAVAVLVLSSSLDSANLEKVTEAGADGVLDKFATFDEVVGSVRRLGSA